MQRAGWKTVSVPVNHRHRTAGVSNFKVAAWLSRYLRWYFLAFGPRLDVAELNRRTGRLK